MLIRMLEASCHIIWSKLTPWTLSNDIDMRVFNFTQPSVSEQNSSCIVFTKNWSISNWKFYIFEKCYLDFETRYLYTNPALCHEFRRRRIQRIVLSHTRYASSCHCIFILKFHLTSTHRDIMLDNKIAGRIIKSKI